ncbi:MAG: hypothetical protein M1835_004712 [Candelina submexicana]|nr:MAG: hypothetical protein M1835_004712 [Candelina submexicana]
MPVLNGVGAGEVGSFAQRWSGEVLVAEKEITRAITSLTKRIYIPYNASSSAGLIQAHTDDPWEHSGKYALGWVYFSMILLVAASLLRFYHLWTDKIRTAIHKEEVLKSSTTSSPDTDYEMANMPTDSTAAKFFPRGQELPKGSKAQSSVSSVGPINNSIAAARWLFYRPLPIFQYRKTQISFPSLAVIFLVSVATIFVILYCFIPQPLYWQSIVDGSPPLAVRSGMIAVAMMPWIIGLSMKANFITLITGIGHERLNVLHRWGGYLCLFLSLIHTIPFYVQPAWEHGGLAVFQSYFTGGGYIYGTGIASLVPLIWLCVGSLPIIRRKMYELFVALHVPVAIIFLGMLFWHCHNYLTSWNYLYATLAIWVLSYVVRIFYLNWTNPWRMSWLIGEEAAVTLLPENAVKVTIPTQMKWRPGQYVYLRMPGISLFENHPFTVASLCSEDFPSEYGTMYRDMTLVFRPFGGFTQKVLNSAIEKGPCKTYRAFIDGPYGGMQRRIDAFDDVILFAGGSGITAVVSQLLELVKRMRDGKAVTKKVQVIWALKRMESTHWFQEELRICRQYAPPDSVHCQFYITVAKRHGPEVAGIRGPSPSPLAGLFHSKINDTIQGIASKRTSALIRDEAEGDPEREKELRQENEDGITALPQASIQPPKPAHTRAKSKELHIQIPTSNAPPQSQSQNLDFGFPSTPTNFQKNLMRFAFLPVGGVQKKEGWTMEYGRPDIPFMLRQMSKGFGKRTCVFICGPPSMRMDVSRAVAGLQSGVWGDPMKDEIFLHTENYAI